MYDPTIGRWTSQDPIGFEAGDANLYRYVGNGPTNGVDPSGLRGTANVTPKVSDGKEGTTITIELSSFTNKNTKITSVEMGNTYFKLPPNIKTNGDGKATFEVKLPKDYGPNMTTGYEVVVKVGEGKKAEFGYGRHFVRERKPQPPEPTSLSSVSVA